jgi:hypothetical protein
VQVLLAAMLAPQGEVPPLVEIKSPLATTLLIETAVVWLFVTVTTWTALVLPTETVPNEMLVGDIVTGSTPVPVALSTCVLTEAVSLIVIPAAVLPVTRGVKVMVMVHVWPAFNVPLQGVEPLGATV